LKLSHIQVPYVLEATELSTAEAVSGKLSQANLSMESGGERRIRSSIEAGRQIAAWAQQGDTMTSASVRSEGMICTVPENWHVDGYDERRPWEVCLQAALATGSLRVLHLTANRVESALPKLLRRLQKRKRMRFCVVVSRLHGKWQSEWLSARLAVCRDFHGYTGQDFAVVANATHAFLPDGMMLPSNCVLLVEVKGNQ
jgi:hypothetical protein